jgi:oligopeptide transport system substrate-binding protein
VVWRCGSAFNQGYCNPALDALLDRADAELGPENRIALYEEAGHMLVADVPAIFVHTAFGQCLVKPYVVGYSRTALNGNYPG